MASNIQPRKLVQRYFAERYLLITILSFAFSLAATRFFLNLTGYPQLGNSTLHIAHVLWGGLLLFAGGLLPLIFASRRAFDLSALTLGLGMGLFIDEIGKFITRSNDYFFPAATPIIYAFLLLTIFVFLRVRASHPENLRSALYHVFEQFEELLEDDLSRLERDNMLASLQNALKDDTNAGLGIIARDIIAYLNRQESALVPHQPDLFENLMLRLLGLESRWFRRRRFFNTLLLVWVLWGLITLAHPMLALLAAQTRLNLTGLAASLLTSDLLDLNDLSITGIIRLVGEALCGGMLVLTLALAALKKKSAALSLAQVALLSSLLLVNLFVFYYDQFSAFLYAFIQFVILLITLRYKRWVDEN